MRRQVDHICVCRYQVHDLSLGTGGICHENLHFLQPLKVMWHFLKSIFISIKTPLYFYIILLLFSFISSLCLCISSRVIHVLHFANKRTQTLSIGELSRPQLVRVSNGAFWIRNLWLRSPQGYLTFFLDFIFSSFVCVLVSFLTDVIKYTKKQPMKNEALKWKGKWGKISGKVWREKRE